MLIHPNEVNFTPEVPDEQAKIATNILRLYLPIQAQVGCSTLHSGQDKLNMFG